MNICYLDISVYSLAGNGSNHSEGLLSRFRKITCTERVFRSSGKKWRWKTERNLCKI